MRSIALLSILMILPCGAHADPSAFTTGPFIEDFRAVADVHDVSGDGYSSAGLVAAPVDRGVRIVVCGQSAAYNDVSVDDLLPGVEMALSAMTVHALLQQQGYSLNPF